MYKLTALTLAASLLDSATALTLHERRVAASTMVLNVPIKIASGQLTGLTSDVEFNPAVFRDGGGGGYINGYHVISFSDTFTTTNGLVNGSWNSAAHNTFAYMGFNGSTNPLDLYDFGPVKPAGTRTFLSTGLVAEGNETTAGFMVSVWPNSNMIPFKNKIAFPGYNALAVYSVFDANKLAEIYNTISLINVVDPTTPAQAEGAPLSATRAVPRLFYANENLYGSFAVYTSTGLNGEPNDNHIYMLSTSAYGIKLARCAPENVFNRSLYHYWDGAAWNTTQPFVSNTSSNLITWNYVNPWVGGLYGPSSGDIFWSTHFNTFVTVFQGNGIDDSFYISYSESRQITGPWTFPQLLYNVPTSKECLVCCPGNLLSYAGHAYPAWDPTGQTLLLSWSACDSYVYMATISFA